MSEQAAELTARTERVFGRTRNSVTRLLRSPGGFAGLSVVALLSLISIAALLDWLPHPPLEQHAADRLTGPSGRYWFGTDQFGRDIAARVMAAVASTLRVAVIGVAIAATIGTLGGIAGGFLGGRVDSAVSRVADIFFAFPAILLALALVAALGAGWFNTAIAIGVVYLPIFVRVARGPMLSLRDSDFIRAGRGLGFTSSRLLFRHALPNITTPLVIHVALALSWAILTEASLSFLGLGTQPPEPSLGLMVAESRALAVTAWWTLAGPSFAIMLAVLGFNLLGDALRHVLDPGAADR
jgi:peptide/nickel transport system permease protein